MAKALNKSAKSAKSATNVKKSIITVIVVALVTAVGLGLHFNAQKISDFFTANAFSESEEISVLKSRLNLTGDADMIFRASHPELQSQENFNESCNSHNQEISVLGCYVNHNIYLYDIQDAALSGVRESTAAHELLHAVWARLSASERANLSAALTDVYNSAEYHDMLAEDLETYAESDRLEELHSRIGTEIADLPATLEAHYARYFNDQDAIVEFYDAYIAPFRELSEKIDDLTEKLNELGATIEEKTSAYYQKADDLSHKISEFNTCANQLGCFSTDAAFYARRSQLVSEQFSLEADYDALDKLIDDYNDLISEYNDNVLRGEKLEQAINSNKQIESIKN